MGILNMADSLLAQLMIKPTPKLQENINIEFKKPEQQKDIVVKTKILDKREVTDIDRNNVLAKIRDKTGIKNKIPTPRPVEQPLDQPVDQPVEQPVEQPLDQPVEQPLDQALDKPIEQLVDQSGDESREQPLEKSKKPIKKKKLKLVEEGMVEKTPTERKTLKP